MNLGFASIASAIADRLGTHASIAVDMNDPADTCGRGGTIYVAYAAEENPRGDTDPSVCDTSRRIDMNVYVVHSRDNGLTWSTPIRVPEDDTMALVEKDCDEDNGSAPCGRHSPFQFFPWIAVDGQGRVGVMMYDTTPTPEQDRCNVFSTTYRIQFAHSLDGGVNWNTGLTVSGQNSKTFVEDDPTWNRWVVFLGDYGGMTATKDTASARGVFHPVWTDLRDWDGLFLQVTPRDAYTAAVEVSEPVFSMGDYDRDGDVDMDDYKAFGVCVSPATPVVLEPECEILDFDRDNVIGKNDMALFELCRTGKTVVASGGSDPAALNALVDWTTSVLSAGERAEQADAMRAAAPAFDAVDAAASAFADAIDPQ